MRTYILAVNISRSIRISSLFITCLFLLAGCAIMPPFISPGPERIIEKEGITHIRSTSRKIIFAIDFEKEDNARELLFFVPPDRALSFEFLDIEFMPTDQGDAVFLDSLPDTSKLYELAKNYIRIEDIGYMRLNRIVRVTMTRTMSLSGGRIDIKRLKGAIVFESYSPKRVLRDTCLGQTESGFGKIAQNIIINYSDSARYADPSPPFDVQIPPTGWSEFCNTILNSQKETLYKIPISKAGIYGISYEYLKANGINPDTIHPRNIKLYNHGKEALSIVIGGFAERFTPTDTILFYAEPSQSGFTIENPYWLRITSPQKISESPLLMEETNYITTDTVIRSPGFFISQKRIENDKDLKIQTGNFLTITGMRWVDEQIPLNTPYSIEFDLPSLAESTPGESEMTFSVYLVREAFNPTTEFLISINDYSLQAFTFSSSNQDSIELRFPYSILKRHRNELTITLKMNNKPPENSGIFLDYIELSYPRRFIADNNMLSIDLSRSSGLIKDGQNIIQCDILGFPLQSTVVGIEVDKNHVPRLLTIEQPDNKGIVSINLPITRDKIFYFYTRDAIKTPPSMRPIIYENLVSSRQGSDYIIISHSLFLEQARQIADLKRQQGFIPHVIDVEAIYNEFSHGEESPLAIKEFLHHALLYWKQPKAVYVLLIGDSTSDYLRETRNDVINYVPSYTVIRKNLNEEWASDHWYTTVCGNDDFSDLIIGRISVNNTEDARTIVKKIRAYQTEPEPGIWNSTLSYIADSGEFDRQCEDLRIKHTPKHYIGKTMYLDSMPWEDNFYLPRDIVEMERIKVSTAATTHIKDIIDNGTVMLEYYGHGSPNIWSDERIWFGGDSENSDSLNLRNGSKLPFIINMSCNSGAIDYPVPRWNICISEDFMRVPEGGAIALYVPAGPGFTSQHKNISIGLRNAMFENGFTALGDIVVAGQYHYLLHKNDPNMMNMFILLGDPALQIQLTRTLFSLDVAPTYFRKHDKIHIKIHGESPGISNGTAEFLIVNPDNKSLFDTPVKKAVQDGSVEWEFDIDAKAVRGEWTVHAYCEDSASLALAALGISSFFIDEPYLEISAFKIDGDAYAIQPDEQVSLTVSLRNPSFLDIDDGVIELQEYRSNEWRAIDTATLDIDSKEEKSYTFSVRSKAGLNLFKTVLQNYTSPPESTIKPVRDKVATFYVIPPGGADYPLIISPELLTLTLRPAKDNKTALSLSGSIFNDGITSFSQATLILVDDKDNQIIKRSYPYSLFKPGIPLSIGLVADIESLDKLETLRLTGSVEAVPSRESANNPIIDLQHYQINLPDLTIPTDSIIFEDSRPTEGETVYIHCIVKNTGKGAAENITVTAYDHNPSEGGNPLPDASKHSAQEVISYLAPDSSYRCTLRWDPIKNQGEKTVWLKVDATNQVLEVSETNNSSSASLYVKKKYILRAGGIFLKDQTEDDKQQGILRLQAVVLNKGETEARNIYVEFFKTEQQTAENLIGKVFVPRIEPGGKQVAELEWNIKGEDRHVKVRPTFRIFLKGSLQRITSIMDPDETQ